MIMSVKPLSKTKVNSAEDGYCRNNNHVEGKWVEKELAQKAFRCTGPPKDADGYGEYLYHDGLKFFEHSSGCACDEHDGTIETPNKIEKYEWVPNNCTLRPWNATDFCRVLGDRLILMVGDSTMHQTFATLSSMVNEGDGGCLKQLTFGIAHLLIKQAREQIGASLIDHITNHVPLPDIVILTVGAHCADVGDLFTVWDTHTVGLRDVMQSIRESAWRLVGKEHDIQYIWKTQNPGHINCTTTTDPLPDPQVIKPDDPLDKFHWANHKQYDDLSKQWAREEGMEVLDMSPLAYRGDAHPSLNTLLLHKAADRDCLHYCIPGPLNLFSILLYNMLANEEV